jgi:hypothetical protein
LSIIGIGNLLSGLLIAVGGLFGLDFGLCGRRLILADGQAQGEDLRMLNVPPTSE